MDFLKTQNQFVNTVLFPGGIAHPSYTTASYSQSTRLKLLFVPFARYSPVSLPCGCADAPSSIPVLLYQNPSQRVNKFCIHLHGNACDIGQIAMCAEREGRAYDAHYLLVEYPRYGIADGHPNERILNAVSLAVYEFVVGALAVPTAQVVLTGRSIGTGPACWLASVLQQQGRPAAALILHSPFSSVRGAAVDLLGCLKCCFLDRWENWRLLIGDGSAVIRSPVLFLHADCDKIIDCHHSKLMHEHRKQLGLRSTLFIQESNDLFIKGHNYFDYDHDVVRPAASFLKAEFLVDSIGNTSSSSSVSMSGVVSVGSGSPATELSAAVLSGTAVPPASLPVAKQQERRSSGTAGVRIVLPTETISLHSQVPDAYIGKYTLEQKQEMMNNRSIFKAMKCTADVWLGWCCCPCVQCCEGSLACSSFTSQKAFHFLSCGLFGPVFDYEALRPAECKKASCRSLVFRRAELNKTVREEDAARSSQARKLFNPQHRYRNNSTASQHHRRSQQNSSSVNSGSGTMVLEAIETSARNPLLDNQVLGDVLGDKKTPSAVPAGTVPAAQSMIRDSVPSSTAEVSESKAKDTIHCSDTAERTTTVQQESFVNRMFGITSPAPAAEAVIHSPVSTPGAGDSTSDSDGVGSAQQTARKVPIDTDEQDSTTARKRHSEPRQLDFVPG